MDIAYREYVSGKINKAVLGFELSVFGRNLCFCPNSITVRIIDENLSGQYVMNQKVNPQPVGS